MTMRSVLIYAGLFVLGIVLLVAGALFTPVRVGDIPGSEAGESLIAVGLTLVVAAIGFFLAWANPTA